MYLPRFLFMEGSGNSGTYFLREGVRAATVLTPILRLKIVVDVTSVRTPQTTVLTDQGDHIFLFNTPKPPAYKKRKLSFH